MRFKFVINAFDDGATGATSADASQVTTDAGETTEGLANPETSTSDDDFDSYIESHKDEFNKYFQKRWDSRFGKEKAETSKLKEKMKSYEALAERSAMKYGIEDSKDIEAILNAAQADDDYFSARAYENGLTVDQQRRLDEADMQSRKMLAEKKEAEQQEALNRKFAEWDKESAQLKTIFPNFDFQTELNNPDFVNALGSGMGVERAFYSVHGAEITSGAMEYTAQAVRKATLEEQRNRTPRPKENGLSKTAPAKVSNDVHNLTRQERAEWAKKSMREAIRFN